MWTAKCNSLNPSNFTFTVSLWWFKFFIHENDLDIGIKILFMCFKYNEQIALKSYGMIWYIMNEMIYITDCYGAIVLAAIIDNWHIRVYGVLGCFTDSCVSKIHMRKGFCFWTSHQQLSHLVQNFVTIPILWKTVCWKIHQWNGRHSSTVSCDKYLWY